MKVKPAPVISTHKARVISFNSDGTGNCEGPEGEVNLPFTLPGEMITFEKAKYSRISHFRLLEVNTPSDQRIEGVCKHFGRCGGCLLQHLHPVLYREFKKSQVTKPMIENGLDPFVVGELVVLPFGRRRRANADAIKMPEGIRLGFHGFKSHRIVDMEECHTMLPELATLIQPLKVLLFEILSDYQKAKVFLTQTAVGIDLSLEVQGVLSLEEDKRERIRFFGGEQNLARFTFRHGKKMDVIHEQARPVVIFDGVEVPVDAYSFLQATEEADGVLAKHVIDNLPNEPQKIADLFCGRGTLSFPLSQKARVDGYESDQQALMALQEGILKSKRPITSYQRDLFTKPLSVEELNPYDVVVIDPPRAGAEAQCINLASSQVGKIIYVSCNPQTFARDAATLISGGYNLINVTPVDQFAWSPHVEVVGVFEMSTR
jgi:23S rRNA (uracil1939-C5)-methyltransferase